jgi:hypothetical protein
LEILKGELASERGAIARAPPDGDPQTVGPYTRVDRQLERYPIASNASIEAPLEPVKLFECISKRGGDVCRDLPSNPLGLRTATELRR